MRDNGILDLSTEVKELLWEHECVILPNLGAIITRTTEAALNPYNHLIKPKSKTIFFNPGILNTDGLLANHIADKYGMGYANAVKALEKEIEIIKNEITEGKKINWKGLGEFFGTSEKVFFIPAQDSNFLQETFGLFPIPLKPIAQAVKETATETTQAIPKQHKIVAAPVELNQPSAMTPEHNTPLPLEYRQKGVLRFIKWPMAAAVISFLVYTAIKNEDRTFYTHQEATVVPYLMENGTIIDNETTFEGIEESSNDTYNDTTAAPFEGEFSQSEVMANDVVENTSEEDNIAPITAQTIDPKNYDLNNRYHIVIYKTIMEENVSNLLEKGKFEAYNSYALRLNNSKLIRIALFSSNQLKEAEEKLNIFQSKFAEAELLDKKQYNHL